VKRFCEKILAIEVKSAKSVKKEDFKHIIDFQERSQRDILGVVFYGGENIVGFSEQLVAIPLAFFL